jgi:hypothetical protein
VIEEKSPLDALIERLSDSLVDLRLIDVPIRSLDTVGRVPAGPVLCHPT